MYEIIKSMGKEIEGLKNKIDINESKTASEIDNLKSELVTMSSFASSSMLPPSSTGATLQDGLTQHIDTQV